MTDELIKTRAKETIMTVAQINNKVEDCESTVCRQVSFSTWRSIVEQAA